MKSSHFALLQKDTLEVAHPSLGHNGAVDMGVPPARTPDHNSFTLESARSHGTDAKRRHTKGGARYTSGSGWVQNHTEARMLHMAETEHAKRMRVLELKEEVLLLKKRKLEKELEETATPPVGGASSSGLSASDAVFRFGDNAYIRNLWQPPPPRSACDSPSDVK